jgi:tRNA-binding EMAP/Myf-like protein
MAIGDDRDHDTGAAKITILVWAVRSAATGARFRSQISACMICVGQNGGGSGFSPSTDTPDLRSSYVQEGPAEVEFCASRSSLYVLLTMYVRTYIQESSWNPNSSTLELDRQQHVCPAQLRSCDTFVSLSFHPHKKKFCAYLKNDIFS